MFNPIVKLAAIIMALYILAGFNGIKDDLIILHKKVKIMTEQQQKKNPNFLSEISGEI